MARERRPFSPEQHHNIIPPGRGGSRFGILSPPVIAPERPVTIPTQPHPDRAQPAPEQRPVKPEKDHTGRNIVLVTTGLGVLGAGAYAAYETIPAVHKRVDSFLNSFTDNRLVLRAGAETKKVNRVEVFDNKARSGEVGTIKRIPEEEVGKLDSFAKINDRNTVLAIFPIDVSTSNKPDTKLKFTKSHVGPGTDQDMINRADQGYLNIFYFENVPAGSTILAPSDGRLYLYSFSKNPNPDYPIGNAALEFQAREGEEYRMIISGSTGSGINSKSDVFKSLTNAPVIKDGMSSDEILVVREKKATFVKKGERIMQVGDNEVRIGFQMRGNNDLSTRKETIINGEKLPIVQKVPTNVELFLSEDGEIVQPQPTN